MFMALLLLSVYKIPYTTHKSNRGIAMSHLTEEQFKAALPKGMQKRVDQSIMVNINNVLSNSMVAEELRENMLGFSSVLRDGKYKLESYVNAVKFISFRLMGDTLKQSYCKTFPDKIARWAILLVSDKDISKYVSIYNKSKLVQAVYEQSLTPTYILNADNYQKAINTQVSIMEDLDISPKVRSDAANSILNHIKRPEVRKVELDIGVSDNSVIAGLAEITSALAVQMHESIKTGVFSAKEIAHQKIIDVTPEEV